MTSVRSSEAWNHGASGFLRRPPAHCIVTPQTGLISFQLFPVAHATGSSLNGPPGLPMELRESKNSGALPRRRHAKKFSERSELLRDELLQLECVHGEEADAFGKLLRRHLIFVVLPAEGFLVEMQLLRIGFCGGFG